MKKLSDYTLEDFVQDESFQRYIRDGSDADKVIWEEYLKLYPEKEKTLNEAKAIIDRLFVKISPVEFNHELEKFRSILEANKTGNKPENGTKFLRFAVAASVSAIVIVSLLLIVNTVFTPKPEVISIIERSTEKGQRSNLILKDSTRIKMNAQSSLRFPKKFSDDIKEVYLEGEAFFDVKRDENRPFIVHVGDLDVKVLGTSFNIRYYPNEETLDISLVSGKVEVIRNGNVELTLTPNTEAILARSTGQLTKSSFDPYFKLAWKEDIIRFNKASFDEIVAVLERWYNVRFTYQNISSNGFTGEFENMSLENILLGIGHSLEFEFEIEGQQVKILKKDI